MGNVHVTCPWGWWCSPLLQWMGYITGLLGIHALLILVLLVRYLWNTRSCHICHISEADDVVLLGRLHHQPPGHPCLANSDSPCEVSGHVTCTLDATLSFCHDDHWHRIFQKRWLNNFPKIYSEYSFIIKGLPVCSISWGTGKRTRELSWKQSQSLIMWKRFVMWRSS